MTRKYPQFFAHREKFSIQPDGVQCRWDWQSYLPFVKPVLAELYEEWSGPFLSRYHTLVLNDSNSKWSGMFLRNTLTTSFLIQILRKCFGSVAISQVLATDNRSQFCAAELKYWLDRTAPVSTASRYSCLNVAVENSVRSVISSLLSAKPRTLQGLKTFIDNFLLQYRNAAHASVRESPAVLLKSRRLRCSR